MFWHQLLMCNASDCHPAVWHQWQGEKSLKAASCKNIHPALFAELPLWVVNHKKSCHIANLDSRNLPEKIHCSGPKPKPNEARSCFLGRLVDPWLGWSMLSRQPESGISPPPPHLCHTHRASSCHIFVHARRLDIEHTGSVYYTALSADWIESRH